MIKVGASEFSVGRRVKIQTGASDTYAAIPVEDNDESQYVNKEIIGVIMLPVKLCQPVAGHFLWPFFKKIIFFFILFL